MNNLLQDVTITLNLSQMSPEEYQVIMKTLEGLSIDDPMIHTYEENNRSGNLSGGISEENFKLFNNLLSK